ncbi:MULTISPECIES: type 2 lanthipeptide synthetase LanM family protein [Bacillus cereus group]|uniref:type 2 lanthipeptide synthetase LanM family protein n=1 Tax=Bacillus cereus group TaxID=86661 RepID=UPI0007B8B621|nr:type 2 lanthipeptide synthetase LanM family protein [Bacillus cereus]MDA1996979.1 type 2 lanthipeptide synthetase LanM family protein [Bacillus cereus]MDA2002805.1 type 2 lanthipeptide synthetase LanM family protein [Bacillus cereus]MDA3655579.1 type 2 lanthipeptide synthetase LanM family protein [Bacillus cereus]WPQ44126.1 type 2 lanthipeptide synthetase LanM family protein [Bacillus cereus]
MITHPNKLATFSAERKIKKEEFNEHGKQRVKLWESYFKEKEDKFHESVATLLSLSKNELTALASSEIYDIKKIKYGNEEYIQYLEDLFTSKYENIDLNPFLKLTVPNIPFHNFYVPFMKIAVGKLKQGLNTLFPSNIISNMLSHLEQELSKICFKTLILELNVARLSGHLIGESPTNRFEYYSDILLNDQKFLNGFYNEYSVLVRVVLTKIHYWIENIKEIIERFEQDKNLITQEFHHGKSVGSLININLSLGDSHKQGKGVASLEFDSGLKIVYKPRSLEIDIKFQEFLYWINHKKSTNFYNLTVLNQNTYGWIEFIEYKECLNQEEVEQFYIKMGHNLALLYVLDAVDFHNENLIAFGEHPVLIDLESLFHQIPDDGNPDGETAVEQAYSILNRSVKSTGLLPSLSFYQGENPNLKGIDVSGLGASVEQIYPFKVPYISQEHTDTMQLLKDYTTIGKAEANKPKLNGVEIIANDYLEQIKLGFKELYSWFLENKEAVKKKLSLFEDTEVRCILRPTVHYGELLTTMYHPDFLRDGLDYEFVTHQLWLDTTVRPSLKQIVSSEKKDILNGDIPFFTYKTNQRHLYDSTGKIINNFFKETALNKTLKKIDKLNIKDCEQQLQVIHMSMLASNAKSNADLTDIDPYKKITGNINKQDFLNEAQKIGDYLLSTAISGTRDGEEELSWISTVFLGGNEIKWEVQPIGTDLYNGSSGIALFFAYLSELTRENKYKEAAKKSLVPVKNMLKDLSDIPGEMTNIGAFVGLGGNIYTLNHLSKLWNDQSLLNNAISTIPFIVKGIKYDNVFDFVAGASGTLKVLIGLYKQTHDNEILNAAIACGNHLLEHIELNKDGAAWVTPWDPLASIGFAHGVAGIISSLSELYSINKDDKILEIIRKGLMYERKCFVPSVGNWRSPQKKNVSTAWCHGAPGILLSRLLLKEEGYYDDLLDNEIEVALETTIKQGFGNTRSLCHGDFGQIEILQFAAEVLGRNELLDIAKSVSWQVLNSLKDKGWNKGICRGTESVGLMVGLSGLGIGLLKQYNPDIIPGILRLENKLTN